MVTPWGGGTDHRQGERGPGWGLRRAGLRRAYLPRQLAGGQALRLLPAPPPACLASFLPGVPGAATPEEALNVARAGREARGRGQRGLGWRPSPHLDTRGAKTHDTDLLGLPNAPAISRPLSSVRSE